MRNLTKADLIKNIAEKEKLPLKVIQMDVDKDDSVVRAFKEICEDHERGIIIDILVNNAGFGLFGALEDHELSTSRSNLKQISSEQLELYSKYFL